MLDPVRRNLYLLLVAFWLLALGVAGVGYLTAIAELKVRQIVAWRKERLGDAQVFAASEIPPAVRRVLEARADAEDRRRVTAWLDAIRTGMGYANAVLVNPAKKVWIATGRDADAPEHYYELARSVMQTGAVRFSDFHEDEGIPRPHLGLSIPLRSGDNPPEGALVLGIDPETFLYPLIQTWPTPSRTAETLLSRREGDTAVYLNELRHRRGTALKLRLPLSTNQLVIARGLMGFEGVIQGVDYRGVPVLAALAKVPDVPWVIAAKIDLDEIYAPIRQQSFWLGLILAAVTLAFGGGVAFLWRDLRMRFYLQQREAEIQQRALRGHYDYLSRFANDIILLADDAARIVEANDRALTVYGYTRDELIGTPIRNLLAESSIAAFDTQWEALQIKEGIVTEAEHRRKDGSTFPVEVSARRIVVEGTAFRQGIIRDITERKQAEEERSKLQEQLQQAQRLESVGRLAGGVAHDFNNLLTVINGYSGMALDALPREHPLRSIITEVSKAGERATALTRQLLAFSRKQVIQPKVISLNETVGDLAKILRRLVGEDIEVVADLEPSLYPVLVDPGQIEQVLMNLATNARDAMPEGGKLVIETRNANLDEVYAASHADARPGSYALLAVTDTGVGMNDETKKHAFEPFFTTKPRGVGTGLGLATVYGVVKQSNGWIWVYSEPGKGTTFKIYLPCAAETVGPEERAERRALVDLRGSETILVVEDQAEVRQVTAEAIRGYGYRVFEAADGSEAVEFCKSSQATIDLVVTDVVMPGMTCRELADRLKTLRPATKLLYISGYPENLIADRGVLDPGVAYLSKPFTATALAAKVREVLTAPAPPAPRSVSASRPSGSGTPAPGV